MVANGLPGEHRGSRQQQVVVVIREVECKSPWRVGVDVTVTSQDGHCDSWSVASIAVTSSGAREALLFVCGGSGGVADGRVPRDVAGLR